MTIHRRMVLAGALAFTVFGRASHAAGLREPEARAEFLKILGMFNSGDIDGFLAYGPPELAIDKVVVDSADLPAFFASRRTMEGKPDEKPGWLDRDLWRLKSDKGEIIYGAMTRRSVWRDAWCEPTSPAEICFAAGYFLRFEHWSVHFKDGRIIAIRQSTQ